jgi:hypothetical protein
MGAKRINARGLAAANKILILAATCYILKKWMKFISPGSNTAIVSLTQTKAREVLALIKTTFARVIARQNAAFCFSTPRNYSF